EPNDDPVLECLCRWPGIEHCLPVIGRVRRRWDGQVKGIVGDGEALVDCASFQVIPIKGGHADLNLTGGEKLAIHSSDQVLRVVDDRLACLPDTPVDVRPNNKCSAVPEITSGPSPLF